MRIFSAAVAKYSSMACPSAYSDILGFSFICINQKRQEQTFHIQCWLRHQYASICCCPSRAADCWSWLSLLQRKYAHNTLCRLLGNLLADLLFNGVLVSAGEHQMKPAPLDESTVHAFGTSKMSTLPEKGPYWMKLFLGPALHSSKRGHNSIACCGCIMAANVIPADAIPAQAM